MNAVIRALICSCLFLLGLSSSEAQEINPLNAMVDIDFSPDGTQIAGARYGGTVLVWNAATGVITHSFSAHPEGATAAAWSPDGSKVASGGFDGLIKVWDLDSSTVSVLGSVGDTITGLEWLDPNLVVASGVFDTQVKIWDADTGVLVNQYGGASYQMVAHANGSGGKTAVHVNIGNAHIFDLATGSPIRNIPVPGGDVYGASWNPTVSELVTTGSDGVVRIWSVVNGTQRLAFTAHTTIVIAVDWSPNGAQIASLDRSGKVYIWDASNGQILNNFNTFSGTVAWSPDSQKLAYSAGNGSIVIVDPTPDNLLTNGTFTGALAPWTTAAAPNPADLVWRIQAGVLEFYRTTTSTFGAISQTTGVALPALTPLEARLSIGNSSGVRRRLTVTLEDASDPTRQQNCVFWLPANAPLRTFIVRTYAPQAWGSLKVTLSEGTATGSGWLRVDNVEVRQLPGGSIVSTTCTDPNIPPPANVTDSVNLFNNGDFANGLTGWYFGGDITYQLTSGVLEFYKTVGGTANATVVNTTAQINPAARLELTLDLGNSSASAKRITVILNDGDWTDSQTCNFWLPAGVALGRYTMRTFNDTLWNPVHVSVFESVSGQAWTQLDNIDLRRRAALSTVGVECYQPGAALP